MIGVWTGVLWVVSYGGVFCFMDGVLWGWSKGVDGVDVVYWSGC
jgi:hypothetical protein